MCSRRRDPKGQQQQQQTVNISARARAARAGDAKGLRKVCPPLLARSATASPRELSTSDLLCKALLCRTTQPVALQYACSGDAELWQVPCAPDGGLFGVSFTVCIFNICRAVIWSLMHVPGCAGVHDEHVQTVHVSIQ